MTVSLVAITYIAMSYYCITSNNVNTVYMLISGSGNCIYLTMKPLQSDNLII